MDEVTAPAALDCGDAIGSDRGYHRHRYWGSVPCDLCLEGHRLYEQERRARPPKPRELVPCGTPAAYRRHLRREEEACAECRAAHVADVARYSRKRGAA